MDTHEGDDLIMPWMMVDDQMHGHRKFVKLGRDRLPATGLWVTAGSWAGASMTDGFVPDYIVAQWDPDLGLADALVRVGLWYIDTVADEKGYRFHDWCEINRSRAEIEAARADAAERQRRSREKRRRSDGSLGPTPDGPGTGGGQAAFDLPPSDNDVTSRSVTRDSHNGHANVTPLVTRDSRGSHTSLALPSPTKPSTTKDLSGSRRTRAGTKRAEAGPEFEEFYAAYPRHEKPEDAAKAYLQVRRSRKIPHATLMAAARRYATERRGQNPQFTLLPASWLRGAAYENEPPRRASGLNDY